MYFWIHWDTLSWLVKHVRYRYKKVMYSWKKTLEIRTPEYTMFEKDPESFILQLHLFSNILKSKQMYSYMPKSFLQDSYL